MSKREVGAVTILGQAITAATLLAVLAASGCATEMRTRMVATVGADGKPTYEAVQEEVKVLTPLGKAAAVAGAILSGIVLEHNGAFDGVFGGDDGGSGRQTGGTASAGAGNGTRVFNVIGNTAPVVVIGDDDGGE